MLTNVFRTEFGTFLVNCQRDGNSIHIYVWSFSLPSEIFCMKPVFFCMFACSFPFRIITDTEKLQLDLSESEESLAYRWESVQVRDPPWLWNPGHTWPEQWYQWPHKKDLCSLHFLKKIRNKSHFQWWFESE